MTSCEFCEDGCGLPPDFGDRAVFNVNLNCERSVDLDTKKVQHTMTIYDMDEGDDYSCSWVIRFCPFCGRDLSRD